MEIMLMEMTSFAATMIHAIMGFVIWLCVITTTAALMVYHRVSKELMEVIHISDDPGNDNDHMHGHAHAHAHAHVHYEQLQQVRADRKRE